MAKKTITTHDQLTSKSHKELLGMLTDLRKQLFAAKMKNSLKSLKGTHEIRVIRKNIARVHTALTSKTLAVS